MKQEVDSCWFKDEWGAIDTQQELFGLQVIRTF